MSAVGLIRRAGRLPPLQPLCASRRHLAVLVDKGTPLQWLDSLQHIERVRRDGLQQFISLYRKVKDIQNDNLLWGDELEYSVLKISGHEDMSNDRTVKLSLRANE